VVHRWFKGNIALSFALPSKEKKKKRKKILTKIYKA
jgi:hypothetical protein